MNIRASLAALTSAAVLMTSIVPALPAAADNPTHRQKTKNEWRNLAIGSGAAGVLGLLTHNGPLAIIGGAGALYSASRYEHDRKSQSKMEHDRAAIYNHRSFYHNGHKYVRHTVYKHGHKYYTFQRA